MPSLREQENGYFNRRIEIEASIHQPHQNPNVKSIKEWNQKRDFTGDIFDDSQAITINKFFNFYDPMVMRESRMNDVISIEICFESFLVD